MAKRIFYLKDIDPISSEPDSEELSSVIVERLGLSPRKKNSATSMNRVLIELFNKMKLAHKEKKQELAIMTVEEMGNYANISKQTMYDYMKRWLDLDILVKDSYRYEGKTISGYKLNGNNLLNTFEKSSVKIKNNLDKTLDYVKNLQLLLKNEKISRSMKNKI